ncbi:PadR family transcriptional regulator [bacterium]|nr:PadR family transcriptional regulator [bacterium]
MTDAELTLLSLLAEGPRYGYELQHLVEERGLREWLSIGFASIYYLLNKLEKQSVVSSSLQLDGRGAARKRYTLTDAGRGILQTAIANRLRQPRTPGSGFELGLANLHVLKPTQVYRVLLHHRDDLRGQFEHISLAWTRHKARAQTIDTNVLALYTHSIAMLQAEIAWLDDFLAHWQIQHPDVMGELMKKNESHDADPANPFSAATIKHVGQPPDRLKMIQRRAAHSVSA